MTAEQTLSNAFPNAAMVRPNDDLPIVLSMFAFVAPAILAALWCAGSTTWRQGKERMTAEGNWRTRLQTLVRNPFDFRAASLALAMMCWSVVICAALGAFVLFVCIATDNSNAKFPRSFPLVGGVEYAFVAFLPALFCTPIAIFGWLIKWRWFAAPRWKTSAHGSLETFRQTCAWWMILLGWMFLAIAIAVVPLRAGLETRLLQSIERGEVQSLLQRIR